MTAPLEPSRDHVPLWRQMLAWPLYLLAAPAIFYFFVFLLGSAESERRNGPNGDPTGAAMGYAIAWCLFGPFALAPLLLGMWARSPTRSPEAAPPRAPDQRLFAWLDRPGSAQRRTAAVVCLLTGAIVLALATSFVCRPVLATFHESGSMDSTLRLLQSDLLLSSPVLLLAGTLLLLGWRFARRPRRESAGD